MKQENIGSKAYNLHLLEKKFTIPKFFVSTTLDENLIAKELEQLTENSLYGGSLFAVRSSSTKEDSSHYSFAGLFETFLNVEKKDVVAMVQKVLSSNSSKRIKAYCKEHSLELPPQPAVIVQEMLKATQAGVAFSADPLSGDREVSIITAVEGLGDKLVDGTVNGDTYYVQNRQLIHTVNEGEKSVLTPEKALQVAALVSRCEAHFHQPQDIEWAFVGSELFLLQSRPITTIKKTFEGEKRLWDNSNIVESYSGVTTPLTYSFARYVYEEVYISFCKVLSVPQKRVTENRSSFKTLLGLVNGQIYYNMMSWYRILALLPGFKYNREFMEQMMGVKEGLPSEIVKELENSSSSSKIGDLFGLFKTVFSLVYQQMTIKRTIKNFYSRLENALIPNRDLENKTPDALVSHYRNLEAQLLNRWDAPLINDFLAMIYFGVLGKLCKNWLGADEYLQNDLLVDSGEIISAEPAKRIIAMADKLRLLGDEAINIFAKKNEKTIVAFLKTETTLNYDVQSYLNKFGDRTLEELKLESLTLEDSALTLYRAIANMAQRPKIEKVQSSVKQNAESRVMQTLQESRVKLMVMNFVIKQARARVNTRENLRFERTKLFGHIRRIFLEIGTSFYQESILKNRRDIFYLQVDEVISFIEGTSTTVNLQSLVNLRKKEFNNFKKEEISNRFHTYGVVNYNNSFKSANLQKRSDGSLLSGFGCCAGIVKAKVRVIEKPEGAQILEGEILVARQTDPGWIMLFPSASGILVERGSMLSHSAIVAREMNIPAIVGIDNLLTSLQTGDIVEMNGATGQLHKVTP